MAKRPRARSLLFYVVALALAMTVPPFLLSLVATHSWVVSERERLEAYTRETTENAVSQVDRYLSGKIEMLQALATSPAFDSEDFQQVDRQARVLLDLQGVNIVVRDMNGQQRVNTRLPWGRALPRVPNYEADGIVARTQRPYISDLYPGVVAGGPLVRIIVPVIRDGVVRYTLTASLSPEALAQMLRAANVTPPLFASIADRNGLILARATLEQSHVGQKLPGFHEALGDRGWWSGTNPAGIAVSAAYHRSPLSGWLVAVGVDKAALNGPLYRSIWLMVGLAAGLLLIALASSLAIVRRLLLSQEQVTAAANALGSGEAVDTPQTPLREANVIGEALAAASTRLRDQAAALTNANRDLEARVAERTLELQSQAAVLHATLDNMAQGLLKIDPDGRIPICNQRALELLDLPAELMRSRPTFAEVRQFQLRNGDFVKSDQVMRQWVEVSGVEATEHTYERERPNGLVLEVRTVPLADGGAVRTYTDITVRKQTERLAHDMARHDQLTGLPNRMLFRESVAALVERTQSGDAFAVLLLDLDRFKSVNDTLGHPAGDALLGLVAERIRAVTGAGDVVARLGGDEFAILQSEIAQPGAAAALVERVLDTIARPFTLDGTEVEIGASIGVAVSPRDGTETDQIFKSADLALYRAKSEGRNTARFYAAEMDVAVQHRRALELDLRQALARGEFELYYQPVISMTGGGASAFEALLRWRHPERGLVSPAEFIPVAEDTRLILPIGEWVIREACREAAGWPDNVKIAVNISPVQFQSSGLVQSVMSALAASGLSARRLELEITETVLMERCEVVLKAMNTLRGLGVRIALDDFGTGYSSLSYLHQFPLDRIKIDRSFVKKCGEPTMAAIVRTIIGLGTRLNADVTAEGVETEEQLRFVREEGCTDVQGFLFSPPVAAKEARRFIRREAETKAA